MMEALIVPQFMNNNCTKAVFELQRIVCVQAMIAYYARSAGFKAHAKNAPNSIGIFRFFDGSVCIFGCEDVFMG